MVMSRLMRACVFVKVWVLSGNWKKEISIIMDITWEPPDFRTPQNFHNHCYLLVFLKLKIVSSKPKLYFWKRELLRQLHECKWCNKILDLALQAWTLSAPTITQSIGTSIPRVPLWTTLYTYILKPKNCFFLIQKLQFLTPNMTATLPVTWPTGKHFLRKLSTLWVQTMQQNTRTQRERCTRCLKTEATIFVTKKWQSCCLSHGHSRDATKDLNTALQM